MKRLLLLLAILGIGPPAWAAGTCVVSDVTSSQIAAESNRIADASTVIVTLTCTADASAGTYPSTTVPLSGSYPTSLLNTYNLTGYLLYQVKRNPGTTQPTANYTVTVKDADGFALDLGLLTSNGSATAAQLTAITNSTNGPPVVESALTVAITGNAVNSANIRIDLVFRLPPLATINGGSPGGAAGGVLGGTYPNPTFATGVLAGNSAYSSTLASPFTTTSSTFVSTGIVLPAPTASGTYHAHCAFAWSSSVSSGTVALGVGLSAASSTTLLEMTTMEQAQLGTTAAGASAVTSTTTATLMSISPSSTTFAPAYVDFTLITGSALPTVTIYGDISGGATLTLYTGSNCGWLSY